MKYILLVGDGMGDEPRAELDGRTPLEAAATPAMDRLAMVGRPLLVRTVPEGMPPGSDVANLSLMGYAPEKYYTGRGPLEAASMGVDLAEDDVAFRCNLVTLEHGDEGRVIMVDYSAGHIGSHDGRPLIEALQRACGSERLRFHPGIQYRHLLVHRGAVEGLVTVPPHDHIGKDVSGFYRRYLAIDHLRDLLARAEALLAEHPVNQARRARGELPASGIWLWGEGRGVAMPTLRERYGIGGGLISAVDLLKGIGVRTGLSIIEVEGATGWLDTNYEGKARAALDLLRREDFVLVHVEAPDEAGHGGKLAHKLQAIEDFDARIVAPIALGMARRGEPFRLVLTMDHYTPLRLRTHVDWPVPMILFDSTATDAADGRPYGEAGVVARVAARGEGPVSGPEFFQLFLGD